MNRYARLERERRFAVVGAFPPDPSPRTITDRYLDGTRLRLRHIVGEDGEVWKLATLVPGGSGERWITSLYLEPHEAALFAGLPARVVIKTRHRVIHEGRLWAVDVFADGDRIAETEVEAGEPLALPPWCGAERTSDPVRVGRIVLLTGVPAAGKSTLARGLAASRARGVVIPIDDVRDWVVSGRADPFVWDDETRRQFRIAHGVAARAALAYAREGFDVVLDQITFPDAVRDEILPHLGGEPLRVVLLMPRPEVALARNAAREGKSDATRAALERTMAGFYRGWEEAEIPEDWLRHDPSDETVEETLAALMPRLFGV